MNPIVFYRKYSKTLLNVMEMISFLKVFLNHPIEFYIFLFTEKSIGQFKNLYKGYHFSFNSTAQS